MGPLSLRPLLAVGLLLSVATLVRAQVFVVGVKTAEDNVITEFHPTHIQIPDAPLTERGRLDLIRNLESEQGFAHRELPLGAGIELVANGNMSPRDEAYKLMLYQKGQSAGAGDRVAVTALQFKGDRLVIDFNGGPYAKHRFLSHVSINDTPLAQQGPIATGCRITLVFEGGLPEVTAAEVKALLDPLVDFGAKTSEEAYANTLSPKVRDAVEAHEILVGMDRRMVLASVGAPHDKHREHTVPGDGNSPLFEEWIYGVTPHPMQFVRFREGRVVRLEIAELGKPVQIRDKNELGTEAAPVLQARTVANGDAQPTPENGRSGPPPTLRKPGEKIDAQTTMGRVILPADTPRTLPPQAPAGKPADPPNQMVSSGSER